MKFTPTRRSDGHLFCFDRGGQHDIYGEVGICQECGQTGLNTDTSTHMNATVGGPLLCLPCAYRYRDLYEAGFFALEKMVP